MARVALLTPDQAAWQLQVPVRRLRQWRYERRELQPTCYAGKSPRYSQTDVDRYLDSKRVAA